MSEDYRNNVAILIINPKDQILLAERLKSPGVWQLPQGGIDAGEELLDSAYRETLEEVGLASEDLELFAILKSINQYRFDKVPKYAKGKWLGQRQRFVVFRFKGPDSKVKLDNESPEFTSWQWVDFADLENLVEPKRFPGYSKAFDELKNLLS